MGYWVSEEGIRAFLKKYLSILIVIGILAMSVGSLSGYTTYTMSEQFNITTPREQACQQKLMVCEDVLTEAESLISELESSLSVCQENVTHLQERLTYSTNEITRLTNDLDYLRETCSRDIRAWEEKYEADMAACEADIENYKNRINALTANLTSCQAELNATKTNYEELAYNSAVNICCKRKVDDPALIYYYVEDNTIFCTSEFNETKGTREFECF